MRTAPVSGAWKKEWNGREVRGVPVNCWWATDEENAAAAEVLELLREKDCNIGQAKEILKIAIEGLDCEPMAPKKAAPTAETREQHE